MTPGENTAIRAALAAVAKAGFVPVYVWDGEIRVRGTAHQMLPSEVLQAVDAVDDSHIHFTHADGRKAWARVILGNAPDGSEVIADNSITPGFAEALDSLGG